MKTKTAIMIITVLFFVIPTIKAQEVVYGTVRTDGYDKITKGAFWATRPEAKLIYFGGNPTGFTVYVLEADYFVRFINGENNQFDRNYIVFPKGEKVYTDCNGQFYSAKCGNKIEYIRPVRMVEIIPEQPQSTMRPQKQTNDGWNYQETQNSGRSMLVDEPIKPSLLIPSTTTDTKKVVDWIKVAKIGGISIGIAGAGILAYSLLKQKKLGKPVDAPPVGDRDLGNPQDGQPVGPQDGQGVGGK